MDDERRFYANNPENYPPEPEELSLDGFENRLEVGDVVFYGEEPEDPAFLHPNHPQSAVCRIAMFSDWDGDTDDYGRLVGIPPQCQIEWADGTTHWVHGYWNGNDMTYDDLRLAVKKEVTDDGCTR